MSGWIKLDKDMVADPRLLEAAMQLGAIYILATRSPGGGNDLSAGDAQRFSRNALLGGLAALWEYADTHIREDDTLPLRSDALDALVGLEGFFEVMPRDWITELDDGTLKLPGYCAKNDVIAKRKRAENNKLRQARFRSRRNAKGNGSHNTSVTRYPVVTKRVDQDLKTKTKTEDTESPFPPFAIPPEIEPGAWAEWIAFRRESRFSMKPSALRQHVKLLAKYSPTIQREIIESSMGSHWQGLFAPKGKVATLDPDPFANWQPPPDTDHDPH